MAAGGRVEMMAAGGRVEMVVGAAGTGFLSSGPRCGRSR
ncbi:hypothetical protein YT1_3007 [Rhodococcus ruber]|nr:hypothetical protein YT1_3007 [Rhodococcus ruber]